MYRAVVIYILIITFVGPVEGPGEMGAPVELSDQEKAEAEKLGEDKAKIMAGDKVSLERSVPDTRAEQ